MASDVKTNSERLKCLRFIDQAYLFMRNIPGSPPYWQKFKKEAVAHGTPT